MTRKLCFAALFIALAAPAFAQDRTASVDANGNLNSLIARHAAANNVPEDLVRRVIKRESGGRAHVISKGNYGLMQIRLQTARGLGYSGTAAGLLDADTNMTYAVKYLAGAYRAAGGNHNRAVSYYASGYYYAAKRQGMTTVDAIKAGSDAQANAGAANIAAPSFKSTGTDKAVIDPAAKLASARARGESVASSSSMYSGKLDYY
jgi:soluble lytic murein transglycosylase-like protein